MAKRQLVAYVHLDRNTRVHVLARAKTAIVMSDHRSPTLGSSARATTLTYPALAFALNAMYACEHGYDLLFYQMASPTCTHTSQGVRGASYCKLPAIAHAKTGYEGVAFIDSDSFFLERNLSLPALVARYAPRSATATAAAWFANDLPQLGERANGGFHVWYRGSWTTRTLRTWWHLPGFDGAATSAAVAALCAGSASSRCARARARGAPSPRAAWLFPRARAAPSRCASCPWTSVPARC